MNARFKAVVICAAVVLLLPASWAGAQTTTQLYSAEQWYYVTPVFYEEHGQLFYAIGAENAVPTDSSLVEAWMKILVPDGMTLTSHFYLQLWNVPPDSYYSARQQPPIAVNDWVTLGPGEHWVSAGTISGSNTLCNDPLLMTMLIDTWTGTGDIGIWGSSSNDGGTYWNDATSGWRDGPAGKSYGERLSDREYQVKVEYVPIPEPSSMLALASGLGVLGVIIRRKRL